MIFTISRASDAFMAIPSPSPEWPPHHKAEWNAKYHNWLIAVDSVLQLTALIIGTGAKLVITQSGDGMPHVEINDLD